MLARSLALVRRLREAGTKPVIFLDEPGLYAFDRRDPQHLVSVQELRVMVLALRREGAVVGVHCCGNTEWAPLLALGWDDDRHGVPAVIRELPDDHQGNFWPRNDPDRMAAVCREAGWIVEQADLGLFERDSVVLLRAPER